MFADLGPVPDTEERPAGQVYTEVAERMLDQGAEYFLFETLSSDAGVLEAVQAIRAGAPMLLCWCPLQPCRTVIPGRVWPVRSFCSGCRPAVWWMQPD